MHTPVENHWGICKSTHRWSGIDVKHYIVEQRRMDSSARFNFKILRTCGGLHGGVTRHKVDFDFWPKVSSLRGAAMSGTLP